MKPLWDEAKHNMDEICRELDATFEGDDYEKARELAAKLQYWKRIEELMHEKMELD